MVIGEATKQALLGFSVTNAILAIVTLMVIDIGFSLVKRRSKRLAMLIDGGTTIIVENGAFRRHRMHEARVQEDDILEAARIE